MGLSVFLAFIIGLGFAAIFELFLLINFAFLVVITYYSELLYSSFDEEAFRISLVFFVGLSSDDFLDATSVPLTLFAFGFFTWGVSSSYDETALGFFPLIIPFLFLDLWIWAISSRGLLSSRSES